MEKASKVDFPESRKTQNIKTLAKFSHKRFPLWHLGESTS